MSGSLNSEGFNSKSFNFFEPGDLVISEAGHDKGKYFAVTEIIDGLYVHIADGKSRKLDNPKKKKVKHLKLVKKCDSEFAELLPRGAVNGRRALTNSALRKHIARVLTEILPEEDDDDGGQKIKY